MTGSFSANPFVLDKLPAHSSMLVEARQVAGRTEFHFQAVNGDGERSEWSGWFVYEGEPIALTWDAFWVEPTGGAE